MLKKIFFKLLGERKKGLHKSYFKWNLLYIGRIFFYVCWQQSCFIYQRDDGQL